ncbi:hypothetical protein JCM8547_004587 [Rhodosporidiobolus lusitaniae]
MRICLNTEVISHLWQEFAKSRTKKEKAESSKIEKQIKSTLESGKNEADSLIAAYQEKQNKLIDSLHLDDASPVTRIEPNGYRSAFTEQHNLTRQLVSILDKHAQELNPDEDEFFKVAKQRLRARPQAAKKAYRKFSKSTNALHQAAAGETYRHFKSLVNL